MDEDGQLWQLSDHELWALASNYQGRFWVCGAHGYLAFTDVDDSRDETNWTPVDLGVDADLHGLTAKASQVVVVGDETLWMGSETDGELQWIEPTPPSDGWGQLRAATFVTVDSQDQLIVVVGLDGRALLSTADYMSFSVLDGLDPTVDYTSACGTLILGEGLAHARWTGDGWVSGGGGESADYLGCGGDYVLSSDRWISKFRNSKPQHLYRLPWQGRAIDPIFGLYVAGDDGYVALWSEGGPGDL